jgi:hypothetical protein
MGLQVTLGNRDIAPEVFRLWIRLFLNGRLAVSTIGCVDRDEKPETKMTGVAESDGAGDGLGEGEAEAVAADVAVGAFAVATLALIVEPDEAAL